MTNKLNDGNSYVYKQIWEGQWQQKQSLFSPEQDVNWLGQPTIERNILGQPKVARNWLGQPITGGSSSGGEAALVGLVLLLTIGLIVLAGWLIAMVLKGLGQALAALVNGWRDLTRRYPRQMLVVHLALGMAAVYGTLAAAGFDLSVRLGGLTLVPALWGWCWLTYRLPWFFMPINALLAGGALWWGAGLTQDSWLPTWSRLTVGLPLLGNLPAVLAALPLVVWLWSQGMRLRPRVFTPLNLLLAGAALSFVLTRAWVDWQPYWADFVAPVPARLVPPAGLLILLAPVAVWLWHQGQLRWPLPFVALSLLALGGLLSLSAHHTRPAWDTTWRHWAGGLPFAGVPLLAIAAGPVSLWGWGRASRWRPEFFIVPNLALAGGVL